MIKMNKKVIKLINNERLNTRISSTKALGCYNGAEDTCKWVDDARCSNFAMDDCGKDYAACRNGADDICYNVDETICVGPGVDDIT